MNVFLKLRMRKWGYLLLVGVWGGMVNLWGGFNAGVPLAQEHVVLCNSGPETKVPLYSPSILRTRGGRLVAAYERSGHWRAAGRPWAFILTSDDGGKSWVERVSLKVEHGRLFEAGKSLWYLGHDKDLLVSRSVDGGVSWSEPMKLTEGQRWHQSACNVWKAKGNVYLVMERIVDDRIAAWPPGVMAPVLMRAREDADLRRRDSWTFASELVFSDLVKGYKENRPELDDFGVPFFPQSYPNRYVLVEKREKLPKRTTSPIGWLEANVVQIMDEDDYWYDERGRTFHLFMRAHTGGTGYAALAKVVENEDGSMTTMLERVPSGKRVLFLPFPGGQMRFHIVYDEKTKLYWMLGNQATDSMKRVEKLPVERYDLPNNERHRMVLHFSKNMVDWCFAGVVAVGGTTKEGRHYASMDIDGEDLIILSRSGDAGAKSAHASNLITFHRVKGFRGLVY